MTDFDARLAKRLKDLRLSRGWSLEDLSALCGLSRATLSRLEKGDVSPTAEGLGRMCAAYEMSMSRLMMMVEDTFAAKVPIEDQAIWTDPATGFRRQTVSPASPGLSGEVLRCHLPASVRIQYGTPPISGLEHHLVMLNGTLTLTLTEKNHKLTAGDCLRYRLTGTSTFETSSETSAEYLLFLI